MNSQHEYYRNLVAIMLKTRGVRFSVSESLRSKERFSLFTVTILSIYIAGLSIFSALFPEFINGNQGRALNLILVIASFSLLTISLFDHAANRAVLAEKMLQNAFAITAIMREAERELAKETPDYGALQMIAARYEAVVNSAGINHTNLDYKIWIIERKPPSCWLANIFRIAGLRYYKCLRLAGEMAFQLIVIFFVIASTVSVLYIFTI